MSNRYPTEAVQLARKYYCEFGGNVDQVQKAMRKEYPNWSKGLLYDKEDKRNPKNSRLGWITKHGFDKAFELHQQNQINAVENADERRYNAVVTLADVYQQKALDGDDKAVDKFIKLTDQQIELRNKLDLGSANFETFVEAFELIVKWAKDIDTDLAKLFYKRKDEFIERAATHYGKDFNG